MKHNQYWFKPKKYGLGAQPSSWEGWVLTVGFIGWMVVMSQRYLPHSKSDFYWAFGLSIIAFIYFVKKKTEGEWKWRWGK